MFPHEGEPAPGRGSPNVEALRLWRRNTTRRQVAQLPCPERRIKTGNKITGHALVEVNAPGECLGHDALDNDPGISALPVQVRVGPGSGDDGPLAGANYGAVRL